MLSPLLVLYPRSFSMAQGGERFSDISNTEMEKDDLVCTTTENLKEMGYNRDTRARPIYVLIGEEEILSNKTLLPNRLDFIKGNISNLFTNSCVNRMVHCNRISTETRYQEQFAEFYNYILIYYNINAFPFSAIINFFNSLIDRNLAYQTILNYWSALSKPVEILFHKQLSAEKSLNDLLKYVKSHHIKKSQNFVPWSMDKTLLMLENPPVEYINNLFICQKAFFLCLLADPRRIAEVRALTISKSSFSNESILLWTHSGFLPKNATAFYCPQEIVIPSFPENPALCPVRNLNNYIEFTENLANNLNKRRPDLLWVDLNLKPITLKLCREWFRTIIFAADPSAVLANTKFHSIRGSVASALDYKGCTIKQILQQLNWKCNSTYQKFYARLDLQANVKAVMGGVLS